MSQDISALDHIKKVTAEAGLEVMDEVLGIVLNREEVPDSTLLGLRSEDVFDLYESFVGPAVDRVESYLLNRP